MPTDELPVNDGFHDVAYELGACESDSQRIGAILNEACHVFHRHAEGTWEAHDKDSYARMLAAEIVARPGLAGRLLKTQDRVVRMLAYRALELLKQAAPVGGLTRAPLTRPPPSAFFPARAGHLVRHRAC